MATTGTDKAVAVKPEMDIRSILSVLPHRYPMLLVDRVLKIEPGQRISAMKNVTINEDMFNGHFPGHPVMPGVLLLEGMAQTGAILLLADMEQEVRQSKLLVFTSVERGRFRRPVIPGDQLLYEVEMLRQRATASKLEGKTYVDGSLVAQATVSCSIIDRGSV